MQELVDTLIAHGYLVLFVWIFAVQVGVPLPGAPLLLAAGALAGSGRLALALVLLLAVLASIAGDAVWFVLGRRHGNRVLAVLCRVSLEPDACVRKTTEVFARHRSLTILFAKFLPGVSTVAPPLAGAFGVGGARFLLLDGAGALAWSAAYALPGYLLSDRLEQLAERAAVTGAWLLVVLAVLVAAFVLVKAVRRRAFLRGLHVARIEPEQLHADLGSGVPPFVVDLRHELDVAGDPHAIPGALRVLAEQLERHDGVIPRDRDVVVYCT